MRARDHVAEGSEILVPQPALHGGEYAGDFSTSAQDLLVIENDLGFHDARDGNLFALQALDIVGVFLGRDQFVVAAADKLQQVEAIVVEGGGVHFPATNQLAHAVAHLLGRIDGVGQREDFVRLGVALANEAFDAVSQD